MKKKYILGGAIHSTAKAFGADDTLANTLGLLGSGAEMFFNPISGGMGMLNYGSQIVNKKEFGGLTEFKGPSHSEGGITINPKIEVEGGETKNEDFIFSDAVKPKGSNYTYAELSKKINDKYKKRGEDKLAKESKQRELDNLKRLHESDPKIIRGREKLNSNKMKFGGPTNPLQYNPDDYTKDYEGQLMDPNIVKYDPITPMFNFDLSKNEPIKKSLDTKTQISSKVYQSTPNRFDDKISPTGAILNSVGPASQLIGTLIQGVDDVNFERLSPNLLNYDPIVNQTERQGANVIATNRMNVQNNARSSGQALSNLTSGNVAISSRMNESINQTMMQEQNANNQILNSVNAANTDIANNEQIAKQQNRAAYRQAIYGALTDMGNIGAGYLRDTKLQKANNDINNRTLDVMSSLPYRSEFILDENGNLKLVTK